MLCGKIIYTTREQALQRGGRLRQRGGKAVKAYLCEQCAGWHITSNLHFNPDPFPPPERMAQRKKFKCAGCGIMAMLYTARECIFCLRQHKRIMMEEVE